MSSLRTKFLRFYMKWPVISCFFALFFCTSFVIFVGLLSNSIANLFGLNRMQALIRLDTLVLATVWVFPTLLATFFLLFEKAALGIGYYQKFK